MVNFQSGLLGVSETSSDMRDLLDHESQDVRAAEAVALFCYQVKKWIGAFAAALGGLDTLVFAGGIGENAPTVRARICDGLGFLGIELEEKRNAASEGVISAEPAGWQSASFIRTKNGRSPTRSALSWALQLKRNAIMTNEKTSERDTNNEERDMTMEESKSVTKDPVCGMTVDEATALHAERDGKTFYFCSDHCRQKFLSTPAGAKPEGKSGGCCGH